MNRIAVLLGVLFAMFLVASPAEAGSVDYYTEVLNALKTSPVYVQTGTEGTDGNTAATLESKLNQDDNIVLVMLPRAAASVVDPQALAARLSTKENNGKIVGMAIGDQTVGYALSLPTGVAADQMHRAASVSANKVETLGTFVQNIHAWVSNNPGSVMTFTSSPTPVSGDMSSWWKTYGLWIVIAGVVVVGALLYEFAGSSSLHKREGSRKPQVMKFESSPPDVVKLLKEVYSRSELVRDDELKLALSQCCQDIERYFRLYGTEQNQMTDAIAFGDCLTDILKALDGDENQKGYIVLVSNRGDFYDADERIRKGKAFIVNCTESIVKLIRDLNESGLIGYDVAVSYDPRHGMSFVPR